MKLSCTVVLVALALTACGPKTVDEKITASVDEVNKGVAEATQATGKVSSEQYQDLLQEGQGIDIGGLAFAPGALPDNLEGNTFYPSRTSAIIQMVSPTDFKITTPAGEVVGGTYKVTQIGDHSALSLSYSYGGTKKLHTYMVMRSGDFAMLKLQDIYDEDKPLPLVAKGRVQ
jgi:hypothetical protein